MAQNIIVNGVTYNGVASISAPLAAGGGNAVFPDTSSGDAAAGDIASGKIAWVDGAEITGTASGGGSTPEKGFLPTAWDSNGYVTEGTVYGITNIPAYFMYNPTTSIGHFSQLADLYFSGSVTSMEDRAFYNCTQLDLSALPENLQNMSTYVFYACSSLSITTIPSTVSYIGGSSFYGCTSLTTLSISGAPQLGGTTTTNGTFRGCTGLTSVTIGSTGNAMTTTTLPAYTFNGCTNLTSITVYTTSGASLATAPFGATNATVTYLSA